MTLLATRSATRRRDDALGATEVSRRREAGVGGVGTDNALKLSDAGVGSVELGFERRDGLLLLLDDGGLLLNKRFQPQEHLVFFVAHTGSKAQFGPLVPPPSGGWRLDWPERVRIPKKPAVATPEVTGCPQEAKPLAGPGARAHPRLTLI